MNDHRRSGIFGHKPHIEIDRRISHLSISAKDDNQIEREWTSLSLSSFSSMLNQSRSELVSIFKRNPMVRTESDVKRATKSNSGQKRDNQDVWKNKNIIRIGYWVLGCCWWKCVRPRFRFEAQVLALSLRTSRLSCAEAIPGSNVDVCFSTFP